MKELAKGLLTGAGIALLGMALVGLGLPLSAWIAGAPSRVLDHAKGFAIGYCVLMICAAVFGIAWRLIAERRFIRLQLRWRRRRKQLIEQEFQGASPEDSPRQAP